MFSKIALENVLFNTIKGLYMKKLSVVLLLVFAIIIPVFADKTSHDMNHEYSELMNYVRKNNISINISYDDFVEEYKRGNYESLEEYLNHYYKVLKPQHRFFCINGSGKWYYNTGTTLPQMPKYTKYNLLNNLKAGDIVYEPKGGHGITGHTAIVEGTFTYNGIRYIRVIEANDYGLVRSVLDDDRVDDKGSKILRVSASSNVIDSAVAFCVDQLGKDYSIDFAHDCSCDEEDWYCSELVWAAYILEGFDVETNSWWLNELGVTPRDIWRCSDLEEISIKNSSQQGTNRFVLKVI